MRHRALALDVVDVERLIDGGGDVQSEFPPQTFGGP
jgi:hypothetical protein